MRNGRLFLIGRKYLGVRGKAPAAPKALWRSLLRIKGAGAFFCLRWFAPCQSVLNISL